VSSTSTSMPTKSLIYILITTYLWSQSRQYLASIFKGLIIRATVCLTLAIVAEQLVPIALSTQLCQSMKRCDWIGQTGP
jgi:hypothetical protein